MKNIVLVPALVRVIAFQKAGVWGFGLWEFGVGGFGEGGGRGKQKLNVERKVGGSGGSCKCILLQSRRTPHEWRTCAKPRAVNAFAQWPE